MLEMSAQNSLLCFEVREGVSWKKREKQKGRQYTMGFALLGGHMVSEKRTIPESNFYDSGHSSLHASFAEIIFCVIPPAFFFFTFQIKKPHKVFTFLAGLVWMPLLHQRL